nr:MAG TPA: hypothetical protein [Caudoviricetes sp.]
MVSKPMKTPAVAGSNFRWVEGAIALPAAAWA